MRHRTVEDERRAELAALRRSGKRIGQAITRLMEIPLRPGERRRSEAASLRSALVIALTETYHEVARAHRDAAATISALLGTLARGKSRAA